MRVFVTGATGFVGSAVVQELLQHGHRVLGLARSDANAAALRAAGAEPHQGHLEDLGALRSGAATTDAVIHCGFIHDFSHFEANCEIDRHAIAALGAGVAGSHRPILVTSGTAIAANVEGQPSTEDGPTSSANPRSASEAAVNELKERGLNTSVIRLSQIHDTRKQGLVPYLLSVTRQKGVSAYIGDGANRWPAAHISAVAQLYRLALEKAQPGAIYHAVDEEGVSMKSIAEAHARGLNLPAISLSPDQAEAHFGWLARFAKMDMPSSSALTQQKLNWHPTGPNLIADLDNMDYTQT
ncbi:MAG: SDR family oxidoreductase [Acidobacteriota bacterium]